MAKRLNRKALSRCAECACMNLRRVTRVLTQRYEEVMKAGGVHATQFTLLTHLAVSGPITMTALAERLGMDRTTLTRNLKCLEKSRLVRVEAGDDLRTRRIELTGRGEDTLAEMLPLWAEAQRGVIRKFGKKRWDRLRAELNALERAAQ